MALFNKKKAIDDMTIEEIEKYLETKKSKDEQDAKDRVDESVAEQEEEKGDKDEQDAKDRVDESLGEEKEDGETEEEHGEEYWQKHDERMRKIAEEVFEAKSKKKEPKKAEESKTSKLDKAMAMYD